MKRLYPLLLITGCLGQIAGPRSGPTEPPATTACDSSPGVGGIGTHDTIVFCR